MLVFFRSKGLIIYLLSFIFAIVSYLYVQESFSSAQLQIIRLTQLFAFLSIGFLYVCLLIESLSFFIKDNAFITKWNSFKKELIVSTLFFAVLHSCYAFFGQLGGFPGLFFLSEYYLIGISLSFFGLLLITSAVVSSFNIIAGRFKIRSITSPFLYVSGILILFHALLLGTHFHDLSEKIPLVIFIAVSFLFLLQALRLEQKLSKFFLFLPRFGLVSVFVFLLIFVTFFWYINPQSGSESSSPLSVHGQHINTDVVNKTSSTQNSLYMPGMEGDKSKRFSISLGYPKPVLPNKNVKLDFKINDAANGDPVYFFQSPFEKPFHLIIVNSDLSYFSHIHPIQEKNNFVIDTLFPQDDLYRLYTDFQPFGTVEQQYAFQLNVGASEKILVNEPVVDFGMETSVGEYTVKLSFDQPLISEQISAGKQELMFSLFDKDNNPVTNLHPYLGAFGHLVMIKKDTYEYIHAHPVMTRPVGINERSGPDVSFIPMALYSKVTPGIYKVFGQFNPNGKIINAGFWIEVK